VAGVAVDGGREMSTDNDFLIFRKVAGEKITELMNRAERAEAAETVALANWNGALERAMKAEAELATERARLDWFHEVASDRIWVANQDIRAAIDAAMKKDVPINCPLDARP
jgi:hypothetical protein